MPEPHAKCQMEQIKVNTIDGKSETLIYHKNF